MDMQGVCSPIIKKRGVNISYFEYLFPQKNRFLDDTKKILVLHILKQYLNMKDRPQQRDSCIWSAYTCRGVRCSGDQLTSRCTCKCRSAKLCPGTANGYSKWTLPRVLSPTHGHENSTIIKFDKSGVDRLSSAATDDVVEADW